MKSFKTKRSGSSTFHNFPRFLCPLCHSSHLISRLGVSVIPLAPPPLGGGGREGERGEKEGRDAGEGVECHQHGLTKSSYCLHCNIR